MNSIYDYPSDIIFKLLYPKRNFCQLKELNIPKGVKKVDCSNNQLKELNIPKGVKVVYVNISIKKTNSS